MLRWPAAAWITGLLLTLIAAVPVGAQQPEPFADGCPRLVSSNSPFVMPAALSQKELRLTYIGHATFLIETANGLRVATDYNDYVRPPALPDVITMNRAHSTHFTLHPDPGIGVVLKGWKDGGGPASHDVVIKDIRIRNVVTNIRDWRGGTDYDANSIFVFEAAELCIAHLGHLHHPLTPDHLKALGRIDVALVPVDGGYTMPLDQMLDVVSAISPRVIIPMHFFSQMTLRAFLDRVAQTYPVETSSTPSIILSRDYLPLQPKVVVLPGR